MAHSLSHPAPLAANRTLRQHRRPHRGNSGLHQRAAENLLALRDGNLHLGSVAAGKKTTNRRRSARWRIPLDFGADDKPRPGLIQAHSATATSRFTDCRPQRSSAAELSSIPRPTGFLLLLARFGRSLCPAFCYFIKQQRPRRKTAIASIGRFGFPFVRFFCVRSHLEISFTSSSPIFLFPSSSQTPCPLEKIADNGYDSLAL